MLKKYEKISKNKNKGFTLIELLVVMGIFSILAASTIAIYGGMQVSSQLNEVNSRIIQTLRLAREYSRSAYNNQIYGVYFEINDGALDKYTMYQGASYLARDIDFDRVYIVDNAVSLTTSLLNDDVNFSKSIGHPNVTGEIFIFGENGNTKEITINQYGFINAE